MSGASEALELDPRVREVVERLALSPHPEGGWFRETWRSPTRLPVEALPAGYPGWRAVMTSILFLLPGGVRSALHRVRSEELWLHHQGDDVLLGVGSTVDQASDPVRSVRLGQGGEAQLQAIVPAGEWQTAEAVRGPTGYSLVGCVVAPGFEFADFEMAERETSGEGR